MLFRSVDYTMFFRLLSSYDGDKTWLLQLADYKEPLSEWLDAYDVRISKEESTCRERHTKMSSINPKYILKNHILQEAIDKAHKHDFSMIDDLLKVAHSPYDEHLDLEYLCKVASKEKKNIKLSCSS